ncbi:MAG: DUF1707 SHOCT-like domain-containing protein [Pseudonocardiaceae bacterium]
MSEVEPRELRVSDAEREHVVALLQRATGQGMITLDEFSSRTDTALAARTRGELNAVLVDLPGMQLQGEPAHPRVPGGDVVELRTTGSSLVREGAWVVPAALRLAGRLGSRKLNLTRAVIEHPVVDIEFDDYGSSTVLILPRGATADCDRLEASFGSVQNKVGPGPPDGRPHLILHGRVRLGSVTLRHSLGDRLRRMLGS